MADGATVDPQALEIRYGFHLIGGRAGGQYLNVSFTKDQYTMGVGVDGEGFFVRSADLSASITVTLLQTSDSNVVLSTMFLLDQTTPGGLLMPLNIDETNGIEGRRTVYSATRARIAKWADGIWSDGAEVRSWTFITTRLSAFIGGLPPTPLYSGGAGGPVGPGGITI